MAGAVEGFYALGAALGPLSHHEEGGLNLLGVQDLQDGLGIGVIPG